MNLRNNPVAGEFYRHFKGNLYQIIGIAKHSETGEQMVVYQALYGDYGLYTRPLAMFMSSVDRIKYPDAVQESRFEKIVPGALENAAEKTASNIMPEKMEMPSQVGAAEETSESEETVREEILRFLDAEGAGEKLEVLWELRKKMDENLLTTIELSLDLLPDEKESMERRFELVEQTLAKRVRFEGGRLR
ncbi:MAG: DUF1653 domain-containing protein [Lachnospiraceae bacterium]|nr:DUF1653 domain-containing protein [Lachnospiraceae bacterium]